MQGDSNKTKRSPDGALIGGSAKLSTLRTVTIVLLSTFLFAIQGGRPVVADQQNWYFYTDKDNLFGFFTLLTAQPSGKLSSRIVLNPQDDFKWKSDWAIHNGNGPPFKLKPTSWLFSLWLASSKPAQVEVTIGYWVACFTCNITGAPKFITSGYSPIVMNPLSSRELYNFTLQSDETTIPVASKLATEVALFVVITAPADSIVDFYLGGLDAASSFVAVPGTPIPEFGSVHLSLLLIVILTVSVSAFGRKRTNR